MSSAKRKGVRVRGIALPTEHGSWGFLFEPLVAAAAVAPTFGSLSVSILVIGAFLVRQPFKIRLSNAHARRDLPQNRVATNLILIYGTIFVLGLFGTFLLINFENLFPFALILPLALFQIYNDATKKSRQLLPELTGAVAISSSAAVIALAAGWKIYPALALWGILIARFVPSILYVRNRLLLEKGKPSAFLPVIAVHIAALAFTAGLWFLELSSWIVVVVFAILVIRASVGLSRFRKKRRAMIIGVGEVFYGLLTVTAIIVGHYFL